MEISIFEISLWKYYSKLYFNFKINIKWKYFRIVSGFYFFKRSTFSIDIKFCQRNEYSGPIFPFLDKSDKSYPGNKLHLNGICYLSDNETIQKWKDWPTELTFKKLRGRNICVAPLFRDGNIYLILLCQYTFLFITHLLRSIN